MPTKFHSLRWIAALIGTLLPLSSYAVSMSLDNLNLDDYNSLVKEFSANSQYSTVTPASSLGGLWGFEFGITGGLTKAPDTQALVLRNDASTSFKSLYHAGAVARLGLPYGITAEALYLPKITISSVTLKRWGLAAQWTLTDSVLENLPFNLATKLFITKTTLNYSQTINNASTANVPVTANLSFDDTLWGLQAIASYKILVFEPYLGLGWTSAKGELAVDASGTATIFNQSVFGSAAKSATSKPTSSQILAGLDIRLAFFSLGAEYERAFAKNSYTGRLSFRF